MSDSLTSEGPAILDDKYLSSNDGQRAAKESSSKPKSPHKLFGEVNDLSSSSTEDSLRSGQFSEWSNSENVPPVVKKPATIYEKWKSIEVEPGVRCSVLCPSKGGLISTPLNEPLIKTTWDVFRHGLALSPHGKCLGWRVGETYQWWTYTEVAERVRQLCGAFKAEPNLSRQNFVGIYAACIPQWLICSLAINARSMCVVPLYDTLGPESCTHIINQVEMMLLFIDSASAVGRILDSAKNTPSLKKIVCFQQELSADLVEKARNSSISLVTFNEFVHAVDPEDRDVYDVPKDTDIAMIQYTSGTTGLPKGVVQTHRAYVANLSGIDFPFAVRIHSVFTISQRDVCLQYLPLAHSYAQIACTWLFFHGAAIGFFGGNIMKLAEDATILKPTIMLMVPRLMNRIYCKIKAEIGESGLKSKIFWYCYYRKKDLIDRGIITRDSIWDTLCFRRIQRIFGGNVRIITVGSAPISAEVLEFWRVCFGALVVEGYGQTECTAVATFAIGPTGGNVGHPLPCNLIKLVDVEECGYFVKDGKGEVCIKGPNVMNGYYKLPDKTAEAIDEDGWLHTGDIGEFLPGGSMRIFDRKKHIFKLAQGEYIAPEKIENVYAMCSLVAQVFVDGSSLESFTVAVVVPEAQAAQSWARAANVVPESVMTHPDFMKHVFNEMTKVGKANKLNSLEQVKNIHITVENFTPANGLLTPSLKNKRPELRRYFKAQLEAMYAAGPLTGETNGTAANGRC